jgi:hypothetical protein
MQRIKRINTKCWAPVFLAVALLFQPVAQPSEVITLFNGEDFTGLVRYLPGDRDVEKTWQVVDRVIACSGKPNGYLRTAEKYKDYRLTFEYRWPGRGGNSGLLVHIQEEDKVWPQCIEGQMQHHHAGDFWVIDGADFREHIDPIWRRVPKQEASSEKPVGEWNTYTAEVRDDTIQLFVNGVLQNIATECTLTEGYIGWQAEGTPLELRNMTLVPLH